MRTYPVEAVGNRFLLVDRRETGDEDWSRVALEVCWGDDAERALCDGLLVIDVGDPIRLRMFNPDGTEDFCGNGLLCAASYAWETCGLRRPSFEVLHLGRTVPVNLTIREEAVVSASMLLPAPQFKAKEIPMEWPHHGDAPFEARLDGFPHALRPVSTGTPHAVILVDRLPGDGEFRELSRRLENHPAFPERTTVDWVERAEAGRVRIRIWERGVGETLGCGTGAAAVAAVTHGLLHDGSLAVESKGGVLLVEWSGTGPIRVEGSAKVPSTASRE
jgi:diaminopimelate epimerase